MRKSAQVKTITPTFKEFKNFKSYIETIDVKRYQEVGVVKILPPRRWKPKEVDYNLDNIDLFCPSYGCQVLTGGEGAFMIINLQDDVKFFPQWVHENQDERYIKSLSSEQVETMFWSNPADERHSSFIDDSQGTLFKTKEWSLDKLETCLDYIGIDSTNKVTGINRSHLRFGSCFSTLGWHLSEFNSYSFNYLHFGAPRTWYIIPPEFKAQFENLANSLFPKHAELCPGYLNHKLTILSLKLLKEYNIHYNKVIQAPGELMLTYSNSYRLIFDHGFNCTETALFYTQHTTNYLMDYKICKCREDIEAIHSTFIERLDITGYSQANDHKRLKVVDQPINKNESNWLSFKVEQGQHVNASNYREVCQGLDNLCNLPLTNNAFSTLIGIYFLTMPPNFSKKSASRYQQQPNNSYGKYKPSRPMAYSKYQSIYYSQHDKENIPPNTSPKLPQENLTENSIVENYEQHFKKPVDIQNDLTKEEHHYTTLNSFNDRIDDHVCNEEFCSVCHVYSQIKSSNTIGNQSSDLHGVIKERDMPFLEL